MKHLILCASGLPLEIVEQYSKYTKFFSKAKITPFTPPVFGPYSSWHHLLTGSTDIKYHNYFGGPKEFGYLDAHYKTDETPYVWEQIPGTVGVFNFPLSFPVKKVNGWCVAGGTPASTAKYQLVYPCKLAEELPDKYITDIFLRSQSILGNYDLLKDADYYKFHYFKDEVESLRLDTVLKLCLKNPIDSLFYHTFDPLWTGERAKDRQDLNKQLYISFQFIDNIIQTLKVQFDIEDITVISNHGKLIKKGLYEDPSLYEPVGFAASSNSAPSNSTDIAPWLLSKLT